jgi:hypothetical protein
MSHESPRPVSDIDEAMRADVARTRTLQRVFLVMLVVFTAGFGVGCGWLLIQEQQLSSDTSCQVTYNHKYAEVQVIRTRLTNEDNDATNALIEAVFTVPPGETHAQSMARILRAYASYKATQKLIARERAEHQVPAVPSC